MLKLYLYDQDETARLGALLARLLRPGDVILFMGDLGAGKTFLIREIAKNMGVDTRLVTSPTFSILHTYECLHMTIVHADLYRLGPEADIGETGLVDHILEEKGCGLIEWGDFLSEKDRKGLHLLEIRLHFTQENSDDHGKRIVEISAKDSTWEERLAHIKKMVEKEGITCEGIDS